MAKVEAFRSDSGEYRWRVIEAGESCELRPGRIMVPPMATRKRKAVEKALDKFLAKVAAEGSKQVGA